MRLVVVRAGLPSLWCCLPAYDPERVLRVQLYHCFDFFGLDLTALGSVLQIAPGVTAYPSQFFELGKLYAAVLQHGYNALFYHAEFI